MQKKSFHKTLLVVDKQRVKCERTFFLLKVFFQQIILLFECCDILSIVDQSLLCSFDIRIYNSVKFVN